MWQSLLCLLMTCSYKPSDRTMLAGEKLKITTVPNTPYITLKDNHDSLSGNDKYEGFFKDVLDELADIMLFDYEIHDTKDSRYGACLNYNKDIACAEWTGMVGEVVRGEADMALGDITITPERILAVDATQPIINGGLVTVTKSDVEASSVEDLLDQGYKFMMYEGGATNKFVSSSTDSTINRIWQNREFISSNREGIEKLKNSSGKYALLMEHMSKYTVAMDCQLKVVGEPMNSLGFGLVIPKGAAKRYNGQVMEYRTILNYGIAKLKREGVISRLENKWWPARKC
eukprot:TRINITY_DN8744_c0_g1_i1.p1 TRINITY_DN8744_c0_g1~~TRINITY_DN8744_c0_g1_i1.p1  ORF type:complete len:287 (-),score=100.23 TRINITY_DN8744_c0_g1_i1:117-977(-)